MHQENKDVFDRLNITNYHKKGYEGQGINICVYDTNFKPNDLPFADELENIIPLSENALQEWTDEDDHGIMVLDIVVQVAPKANIYYYSMDDNQYWSIFEDLEDASIDIFTTSIGRFTYPDLLRRRSEKSKTILFAAAGNDAEGGLSRPAKEKEWIAVGSTHDGKTRSEYSSIGEGLEVMGMSNLYARNKKGEKVRARGTSFASPLVAAMTALYLSANNLNKHEARDMIRSQAKSMDEEERSEKTGFGLFVLPKFPHKSKDQNKDTGIQTFKDIDDHWSKESIKHLSKKGIIGGYDDNTIRPNKNITRAEFFTIVDRCLNGK